MNCQVRSVVTLCILPTFPCSGKGFEGYQHELDMESIFRLPYEKSFILPAENCGMWALGRFVALFQQVAILLTLASWHGPRPGLRAKARALFLRYLP